MNADAIVKALKCCNVPSGRACSECPYHEVGAECRTKRNKDAAELIVKLVDENRDLKTDLADAEEEYDRVYEQAEADIRGNMADGGTSCHWCMTGHRSDAIIKMQKRLEELYTDEVITDDMTVSIGVIKQNIKDVVKEMLED